jgi:Transposase zinc-binding domain
VPVTIERCNTPNDLLHRLVREGLPELRRALEEVDRQLPRTVERELERFTTCGDPAAGFAWLPCEGCDHHRLVPFTCKGRGFCPSCGGRRMTERAARWVDELFPIVAVRQCCSQPVWTTGVSPFRGHAACCWVLRPGLDGPALTPSWPRAC